jgi:hypothetical protein
MWARDARDGSALLSMRRRASHRSTASMETALTRACAAPGERCMARAEIHPGRRSPRAGSRARERRCSRRLTDSASVQTAPRTLPASPCSTRELASSNRYRCRQLADSQGSDGAGSDCCGVASELGPRRRRRRRGSSGFGARHPLRRTGRDDQMQQRDGAGEQAQENAERDDLGRCRHDEGGPRVRTGVPSGACAGDDAYADGMRCNLHALSHPDCGRGRAGPAERASARRSARSRYGPSAECWALAAIVRPSRGEVERQPVERCGTVAPQPEPD